MTTTLTVGELTRQNEPTVTVESNWRVNVINPQDGLFISPFTGLTTAIIDSINETLSTTYLIDRDTGTLLTNRGDGSVAILR